MKQGNGLPPAGKTPKNHIAFQGGTYSLIISAVVLALMIVINILVSALPSTLTQYDISAAQLYSITSNTKVVVNALEKDVTIYWIVQSGEEDQIIENLLDKYESLSDHITVEKKNPDIYPTFAEQYTDETVQNNSLVVECGDKYRFIGYDDIYLYETDMYSYSYNASFDGEGAITSAIDYVVSEELPQVYVLEGHGEAELPSVFSEQVEKENMELTTFSLLTVDEIPEEADCVLIYSPSSDISLSYAARSALSESVHHIVAGPIPDGGTGITLTQLGDEVRQGGHLLRKPGDILADLSRGVGVAGPNGLEAQLPAEPQGSAVGLPIRTAVEDLHTVEAVNPAEVLLQPALIVAEGVTGHTKAPGGVDLVNEDLGVDPVVREGVDPPGGDIPLEGVVLYPHEDGEIHLFRVLCGILPEAHAVMVGDAHRVQALLPGDGHDLLQIDVAVQGIGALVQVHINQHGVPPCRLSV